MKNKILLLTFLIIAPYVCAQWTDNEIASANTAQNISCLSYEEKMVYLYTNLARMYPKKFAELEVEYYEGSERYGYEYRNCSYKASLLRDLKSMSSQDPLYFDSNVYESAKCFAAETAKMGKTGHERVYCDKLNVYGTSLFGVGENCSYGHSEGREIILQLLIDQDVSSLGHRKNCLRSDYCVVGVSIDTHPLYRNCCVMDFKLCDECNKTHITIDKELTKRVNAHSAKTLYLQSIGETISTTDETPLEQSTYNNTNEVSSTYSANDNISNSNSTTISTSQSERTSSQKCSQSSSCQRQRTSYRTILDKYYGYSGKIFWSVLDANYTYDFTNQQHIVAVGLGSFRASIIGLSAVNFEMIVSPWYKSAAYKPLLKIYFPFCNQVSVNAYGGISLEMSRLWKRFIGENREYYACGICGVSLCCNSLKVLPIEIFGEYRIPWRGDLMSRGFFAGAQISLGKIKK